MASFGALFFALRFAVVMYSRFRPGPHPSPLPEVEGTDSGIFESYTDLNVFH